MRTDHPLKKSVFSRYALPPVLLASLFLFSVPLRLQAEETVLHRFASGAPDRRLEDILYLNAGVELTKAGFTSTRKEGDHNYLLMTEYRVSGGTAAVGYTLFSSDASDRPLAAADFSATIDHEFGKRIAGAVARTLALAQIRTRPAPNAEIRGLLPEPPLVQAPALPVPADPVLPGSGPAEPAAVPVQPETRVAQSVPESPVSEPPPAEPAAAPLGPASVPVEPEATPIAPEIVKTEPPATPEISAFAPQKPEPPPGQTIVPPPEPEPVDFPAPPAEPEVAPAEPEIVQTEPPATPETMPAPPEEQPVQTAVPAAVPAAQRATEPAGKPASFRVEASAAGLMLFGEATDYFHYGAGGSVGAAVLRQREAWSLALGARLSLIRIFKDEGVRGGRLFFSTLGPSLGFGTGTNKPFRAGVDLSGGVALITVADSSSLMTKAAPYGDIGVGTGIPLGDGIFLGGSMRFLLIFDEELLIMGASPSLTLSMEL